jgi:phosphatidylserine/phosphatidylglycerophosphate/cardiolipin synthase-like enzyme
LRFGGVYPAPPGAKHPQPQEAISLINASSDPIPLRGLRIQVRSWKRKKVYNTEMAIEAPGLLEPGEELWLAADVRGFAQHFGKRPALASVGATGDVSFLGESWAPLPDGRGVLLLYQPGQGHIDSLAYNLTSKPWVPEQLALWHGAAVAPTQASAVTGKRQVIRRDRDLSGQLLPEFNGAKDYDSCFWYSGLGDDPLHRCMMAGQSQFNPAVHSGFAEVLATSSPDNNYKALVKRFDEAKREVLVSIYHFTNDDIANALMRAAKRGVEVKVYAEGGPVGGLSENSLRLFRNLQRAGVEVMVLRSDKAKGILKRFRYDHSKYSIIDREWLIAGSENYGYTGHPTDNNHGNRGWEIQIKHPGLVADLLAVWRFDTASSNADVSVGDERLRVAVSDGKAAIAGLKSRSHGSKPMANYLQPAVPAHVKGEMELQLVLSPDNSLAESGSVIGMIKGAKSEVLILQNSMPTRWGRGGKKVESPLVAAVLAAARRGVTTRVLLDGVFYQLDPAKPDGNDDTVRYLNALAAKEGLDLQARIIDLETIGLAKIHAKGVIVDAVWTFVGSQNWSENSFRANREVGVAIRATKVAAYYRRLFQRDWHYSPPSRHYLLSAQRVGKSAFKAGTLVGLLGRKGDSCRVRRRAQVGELPCASLGEPLLSATQTYLFPKGKGSVTVRGRVRKLHKGRSYWSLNFGDFWRQDFSIQIPVALAEKMAGAGLRFDAIAGRAIEARGELSQYNGPNLRLQTVDDLRILELRKGQFPWP